MSSRDSKLRIVAACISFLFKCILAPAQTSTGMDDQVPKPGELGSLFPVQHSWNHLALEMGSGFVPVASKGAGLFSNGFIVTGGVVDHIGSSLNLLAEMQIIGLQGHLAYTDIYGFRQNPAYSNTDFGIDFAASYLILAKTRYSPYLSGGAGYYYLGPVRAPGEGQTCTNAVNCPFNIVNPTDKVGLNGGAGVRRKLYAIETRNCSPRPLSLHRLRFDAVRPTLSFSFGRWSPLVGSADRFPHYMVIESVQKVAHYARHGCTR